MWKFVVTEMSTQTYIITHSIANFLIYNMSVILWFDWFLSNVGTISYINHIYKQFKISELCLRLLVFNFATNFESD